MKGVVVSYPGTFPPAFLNSFPSEIIHSHDGFDIDKLPSLGVESRLHSYSEKTVVLFNSPARILWSYYSLIRCDLPKITFLTSMVNGAHRLNFFNSIWAKVAKEKKLPVFSMDYVVQSPSEFKNKLHRVFTIPWEDIHFFPNKHNFDRQCLQIIGNICNESWIKLQELANASK